MVRITESESESEIFIQSFQTQETSAKTITGRCRRGHHIRRELDIAHPPEQWYVIITSDVSWTEGQIKVPELESKLVVHSSKIAVIGGASGAAWSFKTQAGVLSGPDALFVLILRRALKVVCILIIHSAGVRLQLRILHCLQSNVVNVR